MPTARPIETQNGLVCGSYWASVSCLKRQEEMWKRFLFSEVEYCLWAQTPTTPCPALLTSVFMSPVICGWSQSESVMSKSTRRDSKQNESKHLPIYQHKAKLVQAVKDSTFLVVTGETGSGKTTQLPQYLHQAGKPPSCCPVPEVNLAVTTGAWYEPLPVLSVQVFVKTAKSASPSPAGWLPSRWPRG